MTPFGADRDSLSGALHRLSASAVDLFRHAFGDQQLFGGRPLTWGHFRRDTYFEDAEDCPLLRASRVLQTNNPQPRYFVTAVGDKGDKIPEFVSAELTW